MAGSSPLHPVDCTIEFDVSRLAGKTAIVTGGMSLKASVTVIIVVTDLMLAFEQELVVLGKRIFVR